jgi:hypothetical protein
MKFTDWLLTEGMKTPDDIRQGDKIYIVKNGNSRLIIYGVTAGLNQDLIKKAVETINNTHDLKTNNELVLQGIGLENNGGKERQIRIGKWFQKNGKKDWLDWWNNISSEMRKNGRPAFTTHINIIKHMDGEIYVPHNSAQQGWGPFGYDLAIELATMNGSAVVPAVGAGDGWNTDDSSAVWKYYYEKRSDVKKEPYVKNKYRHEGGERDYKDFPWLYQKYTKQPEFISRLREINEKIPQTFVMDV